MKSINYLRGVVRREAAAPPPAAPPPAPPREIPWANPARSVGACPHDVIYSSCNCPPIEPANQ